MASVNFESLRNKVSDEAFMLEVERLLVESPLMSMAVSQQNLAKDVLQTFYGFLVLIFPSHNQVVQENIQHMTLNVFLKNKHVLFDICRSLSQSSIRDCSALKMFEGTLEQPFKSENATLFSYVLKLLCGKTRVKTAGLIFDFVTKEQDGTSALKQILVSLVTLLHHLIAGNVTQHSWDLFVNYLTILTKFIKQNVTSYDKINSTLMTLIQEKEDF
mmetsp:Transcript_10327/g.15821  ORF Transcript_10327/g.15821 Transcript_10327/m.15821 type:complete len:216 (+) Transcript_10327:1634-2281(+)